MPNDRAVGDEVGRILGKHNALAQAVLAKAADELGHLRQGVRGGDDLQQLEVARRVEEVRAQEVLAEALRKALSDGSHGNAGRVGADDGIRRTHGIDALHELALDLQVLDDRPRSPSRRFSTAAKSSSRLPVVTSAACSGVKKLAGRDLRARSKPSRTMRLRTARVCQGQASCLLFRGELVGNDVQQSHRDAGVRQVGSNAAPIVPAPITTARWILYFMVPPSFMADKWQNYQKTLLLHPPCAYRQKTNRAGGEIIILNLQ